MALPFFIFGKGELKMGNLGFDRFAEDKQTKMEKCRKFFDELAEALKATHVVFGSCNQDLSAYLVPNGTEKQVTYYGKPVGSFRVSDHWNWFSSKKRCSDMNMVQCRSLDMPWCHKRDPKNPEHAVRPIIGCQVGYFGEDNCYHCVYGECFDRKRKTWTWMDNSAVDVARMITESGVKLA